MIIASRGSQRHLGRGIMHKPPLLLTTITSQWRNIVAVRHATVRDSTTTTTTATTTATTTTKTTGFFYHVRPFSSTTSTLLSPPPPPSPSPPVQQQPLVELKGASVRPFMRRGGGDPNDPMGVHFGPVLTDINWRVCPGQHWAIVGPNGAGKTTLALALRQEAGILRGSITHNLKKCPPTSVGLVSFEAQCRLHAAHGREAERRVFAAGGKQPPVQTAGEAAAPGLVAALAAADGDKEGRQGGGGRLAGSPLTSGMELCCSSSVAVS